MKSIIIYYSYTGNTQKVADILAENLTERTEFVTTSRLEALDEASSFFLQSRRALFHKRAKIAPVQFDLSDYELICLGTPVWALGPAPAMNAYLDSCFGLKGRTVVLFVTYGSGLGLKRCFNYMQDRLSGQGVGCFRSFSIQQSQVSNIQFVSKVIIDTLKT